MTLRPSADVVMHETVDRLAIQQLGYTNMVRRSITHSVHLCPHATHVTKIVVASSADRVCSS